jgi:oxygen-independent coproporphyrinogen-3 oxidase
MFPTVTDELVARYDIPAPRYTSYPTAPAWSGQIGPDSYAQALRAADGRLSPLSLYAHVPFCRERCSFCGCNVVIARQSKVADRYLDALERELDTVAALLPRRRRLSQIHWGGGTPTFLEPAQIERLWRAITGRFQVLPSAEVSVEVNPEVTSLEQLTLLRQLGFNRLSMGVQDVDPVVQAAIRRHQPLEVTRRMLEHARRLGYQGINFDLIYGLPLQTKESWTRTVAQILELRPDRLAVYGFAFLPELKPHQKRLAVHGIPGGAQKLELFRIAYDALTSAGYRPIGMDHFALPDDELSRAQARRELTRNFQGYTVQAGTEVIAFGVSGISDIGGLFAQNAHVLPKYESRATSGQLCTERGFALSAEDRLRRDVITQIMCNFFVDLGQRGAEHFAPELQRLQRLQSEGLVRIDGAKIELTELGRVFVRNVACAFDEYLHRPGARFSRAV